MPKQRNNDNIGCNYRDKQGGFVVNLLTAQIDHETVKSLITFVREHHNELQVYEALFRGDTVFTLGFESKIDSITAVPLPKAYNVLALEMLGDNPMIVGYSYHEWHDSPPATKGQSVTLSNRRYFYEDNTPCTTIRWTQLVDGKVEIYVSIEAFPITLNVMNDNPAAPITTAVARARFFYSVDTWGALLLSKRSFNRTEETIGVNGIDRYLLDSELSGDNTFSLRIQRIGNIHAFPSEQTREELVVINRGTIKVSGVAPQGWEHLTEVPNDDIDLSVNSVLRGLALEWDRTGNWIC